MSLRVEDQGPALAAHAAMTDYNFLLGYDDGVDWSEFIDRQHDLRSADPTAGLVRSAFLVAWLGDQIVGRSSIRFELNEYLSHAGGHIGYAVLPVHRRQGHASEILEQSLVVLRSAGVQDALLTCDVESIASRRVIERQGGEFDGIVHDEREDVDKRRYWIHGHV